MKSQVSRAFLVRVFRPIRRTTRRAHEALECRRPGYWPQRRDAGRASKKMGRRMERLLVELPTTTFAWGRARCLGGQDG